LGIGEGGFSICIATECLEDKTFVVPGQDTIGIDTDGLVMALDSLSIFALVSEIITSVVPG
jgi:hypothetical protein